MYTNTSDFIVTNVEHEFASDVVWIDREALSDGMPKFNFVVVPAWGDADELVSAAKKIFRLTW